MSGRRAAACLAGLALVLASTGCRGGGKPASAEPEPPLRYEADGLVLEDAGHGPRLCLAERSASMPPVCGTVDLAGWDWGAVGGEERFAGAIWGEYHVEGAFDGETLTVAEAGPPEPEPGAGGEKPTTPCAEPAGARAGAPDALNDAALWAEERPEYVAAWVTRARGGRPVLNVAVTGGAERYERELRARWPGLLCVVEREALTEGAAEDLRADAVTILEGLGLEVVSSVARPLADAVEAEVVVDIGGLGQAAVDEELGPGAVSVVPALEPVE